MGREFAEFLEIIPLKNPKLKVSYSAFYSKRKKICSEITELYKFGTVEEKQ